eukprot:2020518-Amphidinium_carterae.1
MGLNLDMNVVAFQQDNTPAHQGAAVKDMLREAVFGRSWIRTSGRSTQKASRPDTFYKGPS